MTEPQVGVTFGLFTGGVFGLFFLSKGITGLLRGKVTVFNPAISQRPFSGPWLWLMQRNDEGGMPLWVDLTGREAKTRSVVHLVVGAVIALACAAYMLLIVRSL